MRAAAVIARADFASETIMPKKAPNPVDRYVGSRVRMRRMMLGLSQEKLGEALGLTFQQVQKYEKGVNRIGASRLQHLATVLHVPVSFFFETASQTDAVPHGLEEAPTPDYLSEFLATSDGLALAKAFMRIGNTRLRRSIVALIEELVAEPGAAPRELP
jgi:transcriptional regulator with XRE-family HTH domain